MVETVAHRPLPAAGAEDWYEGGSAAEGWPTLPWESD